MRRCLPILALALLLARPALTQEQPVDAQGDEPPTGAIEPEDDPEAAESAASAVPLEEIKRYVAVFMAVKEAYVEPVDDKALMDSAIRGLLLDLDPHSAYLDKDDAEAFDEETSGAYDGIRVAVQQLPDVKVKVLKNGRESCCGRVG